MYTLMLLLQGCSQDGAIFKFTGFHVSYFFRKASSEIVNKKCQQRYCFSKHCCEFQKQRFGNSITDAWLCPCARRPRWQGDTYQRVTAVGLTWRRSPAQTRPWRLAGRRSADGQRPLSPPRRERRSRRRHTGRTTAANHNRINPLNDYLIKKDFNQNVLQNNV